MSLFQKGERVYLSGGPESGSYRVLTEQEAAQSYIAVRIQSAAPDNQNHLRTPPASTTPVFDRALGIPTSEPSTGYYRPNNPHSSHGRGFWFWHPVPAHRFTPSH